MFPKYSLSKTFSSSIFGKNIKFHEGNPKLIKVSFIITEYSFAKINLFLDVTALRKDGFHDIFSLMIPIDWHDTLILHEEKEGTERFTCDDKHLQEIPLDDLTIGQAINKLRPYRKNNKGFSLYLQKEVPYEAGLGIASSNAASILRLFNTHWHCELSKENLMNIASSISSDASFFFFHEICKIEGKGDRVFPLGKKIGKYPLFILKPKKLGISTKKAYSQIREQNFYHSFHKEGKLLLHKIENQELHWEDLKKNTQNVFYTVLSKEEKDLIYVYEKLKTKDNIVQMSGSGSSFFVLFKDKRSVDSFLQEKMQEIENNFDFYKTIL